MFCKNCGNQIPDGTKFCNHCGATQEETAPTQPVYQAPAQAAVAPKKNNTLMIAIIAAVAVVVIAVVVIFAFGGKNNGGSEGGNDTPVISNAQTDTDADTNTDTDISSEQTANSSTNNASIDADNSASNTSVDTNKKLTAFDRGINSGRMFECDMGEYGKMTVSFGYNAETGVVNQLTATFNITPQHSEYESLKADCENHKSTLAALNDENRAACSVTELSSGLNIIYTFQELYAADRAERIAYAEEMLDLIADEEDYVFYMDDVATLLIETYGFVEAD